MSIETSIWNPSDQTPVESEELTREGVDHFGLSQAVNSAPVDPTIFLRGIY